MEIVRVKDYEEMSRRAAQEISREIGKRPDLLLGLATGSTPLGTYRELIRMCKDGEVSFRSVSTVNLDEYAGFDIRDGQSYALYMHRNFFDHIDIRKENVNIPEGRNPDPDAECARYDAVIDKLGGVDLQLLGIGHDGHIGFNEPDEVFHPRTHVVKLSDQTTEANRRFFGEGEEVPEFAFTMGIKDIFMAEKIVLIVSGSDKADIVREAVCGPITPKVPASILQLHRDVMLIGDEGALSRF